MVKYKNLPTKNQNTSNTLSRNTKTNNNQYKYQKIKIKPSRIQPKPNNIPDAKETCQGKLQAEAPYEEAKQPNKQTK